MIYIISRGGEEHPLSKEEAASLNEMFLPQMSEHPIISVLADGLIVCQIWDKQYPDEWIFVGPVVPAPAAPEYVNHIRKKYRIFESMGMFSAGCRIDTIVSGVLLIFNRITGECLEKAEFWEYNKDQFEAVSQMQLRVARDIFSRQENYGPHNPYEQELREQESIQNGDEEALRRSIGETYGGEIGILAKDPLRHHKNVAIGNITLASRAAIRGGINVEQSFSMADSFIQQIEELRNIPEVEIFKREAQYAYARAVKKEQMSENEGSKNPLIPGVKDYIFSHLHSAIQISDIAEYLHVNADYLSHLFSSQEKITIKRYILQEKIKRSQNLLRYSDYSIQEIGFYLGFSSQSHFTKTFKEITGLSPNEYRKTFEHRGNWENM